MPDLLQFKQISSQRAPRPCDQHWSQVFGLVRSGWLLALFALTCACARQPDVVLYCALEQIFAAPLVRRFEQETGLSVRAEFDIEANKTVGLVGRIEAERGRVRCDVFWNNELAHTVRLAKAGLLAAYDSPSAALVPKQWRDEKQRWTAFAARARVLLVNRELVDPSRIRSIEDLLLPDLVGKTCMARPLTGTTLTHAGAWYQVWGEEKTRAWFERLAAGQVAFEQSNGQVMRLVREGRMAVGLTDTDDARVAIAGGYPVVQVVPDQGPEQAGTLLIPNSIAILEGAPHVDAARKLVDFLLSEQVESELARGDSAQIPLRESVGAPDHVVRAGNLRLMQVDWDALGTQLGPRSQELAERFLK